MTLPQDVRDASAQRVVSGRSTIKQEAVLMSRAHRTKVTERSIRVWVTKYKNRHGANPAPVRTVAPSLVEPSPATNSGAAPTGFGDDSDFSRAMDSAGVSDSNPAPESHGMDTPDLPPVEPETPEPPPQANISPAELLALSEFLVCKIPEMGAKMKRIPVPPGAFAFDTTEKETLSLFAPFACEYAPAIMAKAPAVMACGYLVILGVALTQRFGMIKEYAAIEKARKAKEAPSEVIEMKAAPVEKKPEEKVPDLTLDGMGFPV